MTDTTSELPDSESTIPDERNVSLRLEDVTKAFEKDGDSEVIAVDSVNLEIYDGEFIVLVGPSGCGKTTTLRMIAGLESVTTGKIFIEDTDVSGYDPRERDVAMVFQNYALYPHKTVHDNLGFPLQIRKYSNEEIEQQVSDVAGLLDISELLNRRPGELSGGQQQRVSLGRAIIRDPQLFLFDEPLSNLDAKLRIQMRTELNKLHDRVGKTSIYVTHDQAEAMTLGDRVAVMNDGRIQQINRPQEIYLHPENRFVASFVGEPPMNFFVVSVEQRNGSYWALSDQFDFALPESMASNLDTWDGGLNDLELGIRPEDFHDRRLIDRSVPDNQSFEAYVKVVEPMGPQIDLTLSPLNQTDNEDLEFTARISNESTAAKGETIDLFVELENTHLFDGDTGENITKL